MTRRRSLLGGVGVVFLASALLGGSLLPVPELVAALGNDYFLVAAIASVAALVAVPVLSSGRASKLDQADVPSPEGPTTAPPAGASFDRLLADRTLAVPILGWTKRRAIRERLRSVATDAVMHREGCSREVARERVERGEWTDDGTAAAFLGSGADLRSVLRTRRCARLTAEAIVDYAAERRVARR